MINKGKMVLQTCSDLLNSVCDSYSGTCLNGNQVINIKVEVIDVQEVEEHPTSVTVPVIKAEGEVRHMFLYVLLGTFHKYPDFPVSLTHRCLCLICMKQQHCGKWILKSPFQNVSWGLNFCILFVKYHIHSVVTFKACESKY